MYWIVKNGVKMSGMPAWPSQRRDDDVWSVVAFLNAVKQGEQANPGAEAESAAGLPVGDDDRAAPVAALYQAGCGRCHGETGFANGNVHIPRLNTLSAAYIAASLQAYRSAARQSGFMQHATSQLSDEDISQLAAHIADFGSEGPDRYENGTLDPALVARGELLARGGDEKANIPSCSACHGPVSRPRSDRYPPLDGQSEEFLRAQLTLWKSGTRGGTDRAMMMHEAIPALTDGDIRALSHYYASLPPGR
ncbi:c-type cytochrome [Hoeflea ulvae]|uniref:C-type cytochrome n=1 Tax=Hoeflea ulvae TaxID=2983764 RepID=A0ABT3YLZ2_9HYPH|nr:c-type cytochrome [Hoeflea ulvae]MCY0096941.1 c-type cytochrome [Hoeflea ulvae]